MTKGKALIRSMNRSGSRTGKTVGAARHKQYREPTVCERCGAVYSRRTWRRGRAISHERMAEAAWDTCPACQQTRAGEYYGRVLIRGAFARANEPLIRRRIENLAQRAAHTQPQRRVVSVDSNREGLEVLTTSQKLAHRIVHELKKTFRGQARYQWADDGSLFATWKRDALG